MALSTHILETLVQQRWQSILESLTEQLGMPVAMINVIDDRELLVAQVCDAAGHFHSGQRVSLAVNSYCSQVLRSGEEMFISDVRELPLLEDCNPTAALGFIHYYGEPIRDVDGGLVGTLCIMDKRPQLDYRRAKGLVKLLRDSIQRELHDRMAVAHAANSHETLRTSAKRLLHVLARKGLNSVESLRQLGFTEEELFEHRALADLVQSGESLAS